MDVDFTSSFDIIVENLCRESDIEEMVSFKVENVKDN